MSKCILFQVLSTNKNITVSSILIFNIKLIKYIYNYCLFRKNLTQESRYTCYKIVIIRFGDTIAILAENENNCKTPWIIWKKWAGIEDDDKYKKIKSNEICKTKQ